MNDNLSVIRNNYIIRALAASALSVFVLFNACSCTSTKAVQWGYINHNGSFAISASYDKALSFSEGLAAVKKNGRWGYIDSSGILVIAYEYSVAFPFSEGRAIVGVTTNEEDEMSILLGVIDINGQIISNDIGAEPINLFLACLLDDAIAIIMNELRPPIVNEVVPIYADGLAPYCCRTTGKWGYIGRDGNTIIDPVYLCAWNFLNGNALVAIENNEKKGDKCIIWRYINVQGEVILDIDCKFALPFREGLAPCCIDEKYGYIGIDGKLIIEPAFLFAGFFSGGYAPVQITESSCGIIDNNGHIISTISNNIVIADWGGFSEGLCLVRSQSGKYGFIDYSGRLVITPAFEYAGRFVDGYAPVSIRK